MTLPITTKSNKSDNIKQEFPVREVSRASLDLLTLHRQFIEIEAKNDLSKQEKTAKFLELLTQLTNSSASAFFYADSNNALVVGPRVLSKNASSWDEDILLVLHQAAKNSLESAKVYIGKLDQRPDITILAAPGLAEDGKHCAVTQLLKLGSEPIESFAVILQLFVTLLNKQYANECYSSLNSNISANYIQLLLQAPNLASAQKAFISDVSVRYPNIISWIGTVKGNSIQFGEISIKESTNKRSLLVSKLTQAMVECLKQHQLLAVSNEDLSANHGPILDEAFKVLSKNYFCLIPVANSKGKIIEVIGLASNNQSDFDAVVTEINTEKGILGDIFSQQASGLYGRYRESKKVVIEGSNKTLKPLIIGLPFLLLALLLFPVTYKINTVAVVEPLERRFISAPFNSVIKNVLLKPGDAVKQGQVLAELDDRELKWKYSQLKAELERANKQKDIEMASGDTAKMQLSQYEVSQYQAKIELLEYKLENLKLTSPIDGQLVSGDIEKREGSAISIGDTLFEIAPLNRVMLELEVPANDISYVNKDMLAKIRINALPYEKWTAKIEAIHLRSSIRGDANVFIAELTLVNDRKLLRPGMDGKAKIHSNKRALGWVLFHRAWNKIIELSFW